MKVELKAYGKINPELHVVNCRGDGYHELNLSYLTVSIADRISLENNTSSDIQGPEMEGIRPANNLCHQAAKALQTKLNIDQGVRITVEKRIPSGAGMGGGSSDAAAVLVGVNKLWDCNLDTANLIEVGKELGADVPFFFRGGFCLGSGIGSTVERVKNPYENSSIIVHVPPFSLATERVYRRYDELHQGEDSSCDELSHQLTNTAKLIDNDLQLAAVDLKPRLADYLNPLLAHSEIERGGLTGSGSGLFGIAQSISDGESLKERINNSLPGKTFLVHPTDKGQEVITDQ